jgi:hypothetical protein
MDPQTDAIEEDDKYLWNEMLKASMYEKKWMHERLTWLFTPQGFLFTAFGVVLTKLSPQEPLFMWIEVAIAILGLATSCVVFGSVFSAAFMHRKWTKGMIEIALKYPGKFTFGSKPYWPAVVARWAPVLMPPFFGFAWGMLLYKLLNRN